MGSVVELLGKRRGQMVDMQPSGFVPHSNSFICLQVMLELFFGGELCWNFLILSSQKSINFLLN